MNNTPKTNTTIESRGVEITAGNGTAAEQSKAKKFQEFQMKIAQLAMHIDTNMDKFQGNGWQYDGDLGSINESLDELIRFAASA